MFRNEYFMVLTLHRPVPVCLFTLSGFTLPGAPGDCAGGLPGKCSISPRAGETGAGAPARSIAGRADQAERRWAPGGLRWPPPGWPSDSAGQTRPWASSSVPGVFSRHLSETTRDHARQNQGRVLDIITAAVETAHIP